MSRRLANLEGPVLFTVCLSLMLSSGLPASAQVAPEVSSDIRHDLSPPLRDMVYTPQEAGPQRVIPLLRPHERRNFGPGGADPVLQDFQGSPGTPATLLNFLGLGRGYPGYAPNVAPPDTNAAVGQTQVVQWVNLHFVVFDKNGNEVQSFRPGNFFWSGFGGDCETHNDGDPIIKYDAAAGVWFASQSTFGAFLGPHSTCIAISQTDDATGPYYRYEFSQPNLLPDYPKFAIWPDPVNNAYFGSFNLFASQTNFQGPRICAYDRANMLVGNPATQACFQLSPGTDDTLLPADMDSPPSGFTRDNLVVGSLEDNGPNEFSFFTFHADFVNSDFTLSPRTIINVAPFTDLCLFGPCVAQLGTSDKLDSLSGIFMYRNTYRFIGDHESLVLNHSISTPESGGGIRWYELRDLDTSPTIFQSGTYAPDPTQFRWMGSIAMDHVGDICVGYSVSSSAIHPAIRYACRQPNDDPGILGEEVSIIEGDGSQLDTGSRWGDYSSLVVDPVDDCTFWYTTEYYMAPDSAFAWSTQLATFTFPNCHN